MPFVEVNIQNDYLRVISSRLFRELKEKKIVLL